MLVLDKRLWWTRSVFDDVNDWIDCKGQSKNYCVELCIQSKVREREKTKIACLSGNSDENVESNEDDD